MIFKKNISIVIFLLLFVPVYIAAGQEVVTTTSVLSSVVNVIGGGKIEVSPLIQPGSCPGHFDVKVHHIRMLEKTGFIFAHGFEEYLDEIKASISNPDFDIMKVKITDSWLVPASQKELYRQATQMLVKRFPRMSREFNENLEKVLNEVDRADREVKNLIESRNLKGTKVICNSHIKDFLEYAGFNVIEVYGRKEELTPVQIAGIIRQARRQDAVLVVDNLQAGADTGKVFAEALSIPHVAISNFPYAFEETGDLAKTLVENTKRIVQAYETGKSD